MITAEVYGPFTKSLTFWKENMQWLSLYGIEFQWLTNDLRPSNAKLPELPDPIAHNGMNSNASDRYGVPVGW